MALLNFNLARLVENDVKVFHEEVMKLVFDDYNPESLFSNGDISMEIVSEAIKQLNLSDSKKMQMSAISLHQQLSLRHGVLLIGENGSGRKSLIRVLDHVLNNQIKEKNGYEIVNLHAGYKHEKYLTTEISMDDFIGKMENDKWIDGSFTKVLRQAVNNEGKFTKDMKQMDCA